MPYLLLSNTHRTNMIHWEDVWPDEKVTSECVLLGSSHGKVPALSGPIPYRMRGGRLLKGGVLPDILAGRWSGNMIVSARVRKLIEDLDPVTHHFIPVNLTLKDGAQVDGQFFLFAAGDLVDGVIAEKLDGTPVVFDGRLGYYSVAARPHVTFRREVVEKRAIWVDKYLPKKIFISDALFEEFQRLGLQRFETVISDVSG
jgi:hypothetical protein